MSSFGMVCPFVGRRAPDRVVCSGLLASKIRAASQTREPDCARSASFGTLALYDARPVSPEDLSLLTEGPYPLWPDSCSQAWCSCRSHHGRTG